MLKLRELKEKDKIEIIQYLVLILIFSVGSIVFYKLDSVLYKFYAVIGFCCLYICWGYWHHGHLNRLDKLIIIEYSLVSLIVVLLTALGLGIIRFL